MDIADKIAFRAKLEPELPAIIAGNAVVTFGMLEGAVRGAAARLAEFGLQPGSIVGVSIKAPARHLAVSLALMRMGMCSAPFANEAAIALLPEMALAVADQPFAMAGGRLCVVAGEDWFTPSGTPIVAPELAPNAAVRIVMSSGTTGRPKPLRQSRATLAAQSDSAMPQLTAAGNWSRGMMMMDLNAWWSFCLVLWSLSNGRTMCFAANPAETLRVMSLYGCEYLMGAVFHIRTLVDTQRQRFVPLPSLTGMTVGGSVITPGLLTEIQGLLTRRVVLVYGSTEIGGGAVEVAGVSAPMDGAAGFVQPDIELQVIDEDGAPVPDGTTGRIRIRSEAPATQVDGSPLNPDGWFYPGDVGSVDASGRLFITGRLTELINVGGGKVAPDRVEEVLLAHPNVADAGVVGVPDPRGGDMIVAAVVAKGALDLDALARFTAERFRTAPIARIVQLAQIPRGPTGKVVRPMLAQLIGS